jgi:multidrug resistance efflux pump
MIAVFAITVLYLLFIWIVFFKLKWLRLTPTWGVISGFFLLHLIFVPLVGMRFIAPVSEDVRVVRQTIQIVPRLPEPTRVEAVLVREGQPVKKGDPLFVFDKHLYQFKVNEAQAALEAAKQNVKVLQADVDVAQASVKSATGELTYKQGQAQNFADLVKKGVGRKEDADRWQADAITAQANVSEAGERLKRAQIAYGSQINGVNTQVVEAEAQLEQAKYYLEQTTIYAPDDGTIVNLQVQEGMVAGIVRIGAIASFILDRDPYILATYRQENLKFVRPGQKALVALNLYPGKHFAAEVQGIWWASGRGQLLPSGQLPTFPDGSPEPEARLPVQLVLKDPNIRLPIGAEGASLILTNEASPFTWMGQIALRTYTWSRWLYPLPF